MILYIDFCRFLDINVWRELQIGFLIFRFILIAVNLHIRHGILQQKPSQSFLT
jgi:hypothetical protein